LYEFVVVWGQKGVIKMYFDNPEDGITIKASFGNVYFGWNFKVEDDYIFFFPHIHFFPNDKKIVHFIFEKIKYYLPKRGIEERNIADIYTSHYCCGCLLGYPLVFDVENKEILKLISNIKEDGDELKRRLKIFLEKIFND